MKILLTNDDGIHAPGIKALFQALKKDHELFVVAPDTEKSAVGHGITLYTPIRVTNVNLDENHIGLAVSGNPADCVKFAIREVMKEVPDLTISGINRGSNISIDINYSGTVAGAKEAALFGSPAISVSIVMGKIMDYKGSSLFIKKYINTIQNKTIPSGTFLNINIPPGLINDNHEIRITRQETAHNNDVFEKRKDPFNRHYYWYGRRSENNHLNDDTDIAALRNNHISITPIKCDMTDYEVMESLRINTE